MQGVDGTSLPKKDREKRLVPLLGVRHEGVVSKRLDKYLFIIPVANKDFRIPVILEVVLLENLD